VLQGSYCRFGEVVVEPDHIEPGLVSCGIAIVPIGIVKVSLSFDRNLWSAPVALKVTGVHSHALGGVLIVGGVFLAVLVWLVAMACYAKPRSWADRALATNRLAALRPRPAYV
jgi:hypothetical protein